MGVEKTREFRNWINGLDDLKGKARIHVRTDRLAHGNPGDHRSVGCGVQELRIDVGPGYRVYFLHRRNRLVILLAGGDMPSQARDIRLALELASYL